ncbi:replication initiator protein [Dipodfec virus UOA04_Rod_881]|nr:replication initiator protein [Dipodfec virus UOA04_Rod_881]
MPCLYPRFSSVRNLNREFDSAGNRYYTPDSGRRFPLLRFKIPCHHCFECRRSRSNEWRIRLLHEWAYGSYATALFCTITFSPAHYPDLGTLDRSGLRALMRKFWDSYRKRYGYTPRYFFISEYGTPDTSEGSHRFHLHGFIFIPRGCQVPEYSSLHQFISARFGFAWVERMRSARALNYTMKYASKAYSSKRPPHPLCGLIIASQGLGRSYALANAASIFGSVSDPDSPSCLKWVDNFGKPWTYRIPDYYKVLARRFFRLHKIPLNLPREPYTVRFGPFSISSAAPPSEIRDIRDRYIAYLSDFCDPFFHLQCALKRRIERQLSHSLNFLSIQNEDNQIRCLDADIQDTGPEQVPLQFLESRIVHALPAVPGGSHPPSPQFSD